MNYTRREFLALAGALGLASCARVEKLVPFVKGEAAFSVASMNDLHLTNARSAAYLYRVVDRINAIPDLRLTVVAGDLTSTAKLNEFELAKDCLAKLKQPCLAIPGNHDIEVAAKNPYAHYKDAFTECSWTRDIDNWTFIGLDSCEGASSNVTIPKERLDWLAKKLRGVGKDQCLGLFTHHPLNPHSKDYRVKNADEVLALFKGRKLRFVSSGHYHGNQEETDNGIAFFTTMCCTITRENFDHTQPKGFRLFRISGEDFKSEVVEVA